MKKEKAVIIYSGGMDSTVLLYDALARGHEVRALSVDYGQRHRRELEHAKAICEHRHVEHRIADLTAITPLLGGSSQTDPNVPVPHGHYAAENMKATVVPNRNMIMLAVALGWGISTKSDFVAYGAHAGDHTIYPDCRPEFADALNKAALLADWHKCRIVRPYITASKTDIARRGAELKVPFESTWSCYEGGQIHCGLCGTCNERKEALRDAGIKDPTLYVHR